MTHAVAIGDDGRGPGTPEDGPLLAAIKGWWAQMHADYTRALEDQRTALRQALYLATPTAVPIQNSGTYPASGSLRIDLGGPQKGRRWLVRMLRVSEAASVTGTLTGRADFFTGQPATYTGADSPAGWVWTMGTLPAVEKFTSETIEVTPTDHLYCVISSGSSGQHALVGGLVLDYPASQAAGGGVPVV